MCGADAPDVEFTINDNSDAMFTAFEKIFPGVWHINCFANLACVKVPKNKKHLHSGVGMDEITKDLVAIGNLNL